MDKKIVEMKKIVQKDIKLYRTFQICTRPFFYFLFFLFFIGHVAAEVGPLACASRSARPRNKHNLTPNIL